ncbi:MAG: hypothetical protein M1537_02140 [Nitrospirae bacterium]|nr:hypothetical protein [Nitrospirota bacterium]MCL5284270.1 hypothetical protein [Nitrospirota bacterium]
MTTLLNGKKYHFRDHPKLRYHGAPTWPPDWGGVYKDFELIPRGEVGILRDVEKIDADPFYPEHLLLTMEYDRKAYSGTLWIEDSDFLEKIFNLLRTKCGKRIEEIGKMEI